MGKSIDEMAFHVEMLDPRELVPYDGNAKLHSEKNIANIANSIKRFGWQQNLTITKDKEIIIGHGRQMAAIRLGIKVPCKVIDEDLTEDDVRELRIADNLTHDGEYDWDAMNDEIDNFGLTFAGFDFDFNEEGEYEDVEPREEKSQTNQLKERFQLIVDCVDERDMELKYNKLAEVGIECRVSTL